VNCDFTLNLRGYQFAVYFRILFAHQKTFFVEDE